MAISIVDRFGKEYRGNKIIAGSDMIVGLDQNGIVTLDPDVTKIVSGGIVARYPDSIAGHIARWKADTLPGANGSGVASWTDSVNGYTFTQATGADQGLLRYAAINGKKAVEFTATVAQGMIGSLSINADPWTIHVICAARTNTNAGYRLLTGNVSWLFGPYTGTWREYAGAVSSDGGAIVANQWNGWTIARHANTFGTLWKNGVAQTTGSSGGASPNRLDIGDVSGYGTPPNCYLAEINVYQNDLIPTDIGYLTDYAHAEYGI